MSDLNTLSSLDNTPSRSVMNYVDILKKVIFEYNEFLNGLFSSFYKNWKGGYTILLPDGERILKLQKILSPFALLLMRP
jgi:hypothetical protein